MNVLCPLCGSRNAHITISNYNGWTSRYILSDTLRFYLSSEKKLFGGKGGLYINAVCPVKMFCPCYDHKKYYQKKNPKNIGTTICLNMRPFMI